MALDDIKKAILEEAQKIANEYEKEGRQKAEGVANEWNKKINDRKKELLAGAVRVVNQKAQQARFGEQSQLQSQLLRRKQEIINDVYKTALKKLSNIEDSTQVDLLKRLIIELPKGDGVLISATGKEGLIKKALKESGRNFDISSETVNSVGGFIFKSKRIEVNQTYENLVENSKEKSILAVSGKIFNKQV